MEDELEMLLAVYPGVEVVHEAGGDNGLILTLDHHSYNGLRATLRVVLLDKLKYPTECEPSYSISRGLGLEDEAVVLGRIRDAIADFSKDFCLLALFGAFTTFVDSELSVSCGVCLDQTCFAEGDFFISPACHHVFHKSCMEYWARQCRENAEQTSESEQARVRRKQIQRVSESELKMAQLRVANLEADLQRHQTRQDLLRRMMRDGPSAIEEQSTTLTLERDKEDADLVDLGEIQRRIAQTHALARQCALDLTAANKSLSVCQANLLDTMRELELQKEREAHATAQLPCPVCRTLFAM